jgi:hypothetical protein
MYSEAKIARDDAIGYCAFFHIIGIHESFLDDGRDTYVL